MNDQPGDIEKLHRELERLRTRIDELERQAPSVDPATTSIAENSPDNIMLLDRDARIRYINRTVPDLTVEQVLGTPVYDYVPEEFRAGMARCFARVLETGRPDRYETSYIAENGDISYWESRVGAVMRGGDVEGFAVISSNVTERRKAAADRDRFFNLSLDMLCVATLDGYFKRINPAFERTLGYTEEELLATSYLDLIHPDDRDATGEALLHLEAGESVMDFENRFRRKDGKYRLFSWRAHAEPDRGLVYAVARDVTESRQLEAQLRHSQKMDAVGQLAGGIAHDFNNLILAILGNAEFALREQDDTKRKEFIEQAKRAAERAASLTRQLLTFSKRQPMELEPLDLNELTRDLMKLLGRLIPESVEIEFLPAPGLELVDADPGQVEQVLVNLCVNARDAMPQGGLLTVTTDNVHIDRAYRQNHPWAKVGSYVRVTVSDTGVGMTSEVRERLFEPFFTTKHPGKGTGLGLATVYGIVEQHGGFLHVSSEPAEGTVFEVYLPVTARRAGALQWKAESEAMGGHETILVAEDEEAVRNIVVRILEEAGYRVLTAVDGADAVRTFRDNEDVDLVILDVIMPKASGPLAYQEIRTLRPSVPVLFTSGYSDAASFKGVNALALRLVQKPYEPQTLLKEVRYVLDEAARGRRQSKRAL